METHIRADLRKKEGFGSANSGTLKRAQVESER